MTEVEPNLVRALRHLQVTAPYAEAAAKLEAAVVHDLPARALTLLLDALTQLEQLPRSLRRSCWLRSFASPRRLRADEHHLVLRLWRSGIGRSANGLGLPGGVARLLCIAAASPPANLRALLDRLADCEAFNVLLGDRDATGIATDAAHLLCIAGAATCLALDEAMSAGGRGAEREICAIAAWLHSLESVSAAPRHPPDGEATRIILAAPLLRGLRRRAARMHGRLRGRDARASIGLPNAGPVDSRLPLSLDARGTRVEGLDVLAVEWVASLMAELEPSSSPEERAQLLVERFPAIVVTARESIGPQNSAASAWLEQLLTTSERDEDAESRQPPENQTA